METLVQDTIVPQDVIDGYLNSYKNNPSLIEEIIETSERIKASVGCDKPLGISNAVVNVVVGPQAVGKSGVISRLTEGYDKPVIVDRYEFMRYLPSFQHALHLAQEGFDGNVNKLRETIEQTTKQFLPAALWMENDVMTCAVRNNKFIFVETSGTNTLKFIDRLELAGAFVSVHACLAPLSMIQKAASERYANHADYAVSQAQIEQEYNRLIEILPRLVTEADTVMIYTRQNSQQPLQRAIHAAGDQYDRNDYHAGILDGILGGHDLSAAKLMKDRHFNSTFVVPAPVMQRELAAA